MNSRDVTSSMRLVLKSWLDTAADIKGRAEIEVVVWGGAKDTPALKKLIPGIAAWQWAEVVGGKRVVHSVSSQRGVVLVVRPRFLNADEPGGGHDGLLALNEYSRGRESVGQAMAHVFDLAAKSVALNFQDCDEQLIHGALVGADMAAYQFRRVTSGQYPPRVAASVKADGKSINQKVLIESKNIARSVNIARHLTNLPPNALNPESFAAVVKDIFAKTKDTQVTTWSGAKLKSENMNLLMAVGASSNVPPQMVHIKYRPKGSGGKASVAIVGKGITFDTGGVNLKPDSAMRWMKKDMGGSATVTGLAYWVAAQAHSEPCDFYLALAENSIGTASFRPGDIITARSGKTVEIHNTDAEGRLVLADVMDVAAEAKPRLLIDVATLTGAIKAGLGTGVAGLFGNEDKAVRNLALAGQKMGDWLWPMPLFRKYKTALKSNSADMVNAGDGFGGAITAALFLETFTRGIPWLHLDIYAWKDGAEGALSESGGNGQAVQALARFLGEMVPAQK